MHLLAAKPMHNEIHDNPRPLQHYNVLHTTPLPRDSVASWLVPDNVQRSHHVPFTSFSIPPSHPPHYSHAPRNTHKTTKRRARTNSSPSHAERGKQPAISYPFLLYHKRRRATQGCSPSSARDRIQSAVQRDPNAWMVLALRLRRRYGAAYVV
jgi:hypothetical protein